MASAAGDTGTVSAPRTISAADFVPFALAALAVVTRWLILRATHSTTEDFLITLRYAENIAARRGFVYNPGERVLGTTTPLYTLLLALASAVHLDPTAIGKSLNVLADGATVLLICRLAAHLAHRRPGWIAGLLYATTTASISVSIGGMETALVTCACMAAISAHVERRPVSFAVASALLFLLRIDGLLLVSLLAAAWLIQQRGQAGGERLGWRALAVFLVLALPWVVFATAYFGSMLPASMLAKLAVYARIRPGTAPNIGDFRTQFAGGGLQIALSLLFLAGAAMLWRRSPRIRPALVWMAVYYGAMLVSRVPAFGWYFLPPLPIYYLGAAVGLGTVLRLDSPRWRDRGAVVAVIVLALPLGWHMRSIARDVAAAQRLEDDVRRPLGEWLAASAAPTDTVMLEPIGYIGYYSRLRVLDMIGLVSPDVIPCYRPEVPNPLGCIVDRFHPDWLVLRPDEVRALDPRSRPSTQEGSDYLHGEYRWVRAFPDKSPRPAFVIYRRVTDK